MRLHDGVCATIVLFLCFLSIPATASGQAAANVAVIINEKSSASIRIGEYYAEHRGIPPANIIRIATPPVEEVDRTTFTDSIATPIARALTVAGLQDRVLYLVLTKGVPLRISGTIGGRGTAASVDSDLTLLYRRMTGRPVPPAGPLDNPYYAGSLTSDVAHAFSRSEHDIYLVTRLDGFDDADVIRLIDRGLAPETTGAIVLEQRGDGRGAIPDRWMSEAAGQIKEASPDTPIALKLSAASREATGPAMAYFSWGSADPALRENRTPLAFVPGSIAATLGAADAVTFERKPGATSVSAELITAGASGVGGNIREPYLQSSFRPQILFAAYFRGLPLADAYYRSLPHLSWQAVIVGDPLVQPFGKPGTILDVPVDPVTGLPQYFSSRRVDSLRLEIPHAGTAALQHVAASELQQMRGDGARAIESLTQAAEAAPDIAAIHLRLAMLYEEADEVTKAAEGYRRVIALQPRNVIALNNLAFSLASHSGSLDEALDLARQAHAVARDDGTVIDTLGWIEHLRGNHAEAVRLLRIAAARTPRHAEVQLHAAFALADAGVAAEARTHLKVALELNPDAEQRDDVKRLVEKLRSRF
jgi:uncharacterized protein (TIGR03790 family)